MFCAEVHDLDVLASIRFLFNTHKNTKESENRTFNADVSLFTYTHTTIAYAQRKMTREKNPRIKYLSLAANA